MQWRSPSPTQLIFAFASCLITLSTFVGPTPRAWAIDASNPSSLNNGLDVNKPLAAPEPGSGPVSTNALNDIETKIVESYTAGNCSRVNTLSNPGLLPRFRPLVLAVVATCTENHDRANQLFKDAETKAPYDELILVLHARYLFVYDTEASNKLWGKLFVIAHNPALKQIARDYLQGNETEDEGLVIKHDWTLFGSWELSGSHEDNPTGQAASIGVRPSSYALNNLLYGSGTKGLESGNSVGIDLTVTTNTYFSTHYADFWENDYDFPYTVRVGTNEDLVFRPLGRYSQYADKTYEVMGGFALTGVAYREKYKQWVQTAIYQNHYYLDVVSPESGTNIHFEYNWEFYPEAWFFRLMAFIQHVSAQEDVAITPGADVPYSHNDLGGALYFDYRYRSLTLSFYPSFSIREDDNDSTYQNIYGDMITKRREDKSVDLRARVSTTLSRNFELFAYYDWTRTYSNMGFSDYLDRNYMDQTYGIGLRTFVTNY